jgi:peptidylprolyl isomerase domain and WD repeat-containing protein 1
VGHAKSGTTEVIFHRIINFMLQTGDPETEQEEKAFWCGEFEDEFVPGLRHDRPLP